jgi:AmmeMemoRadiSam system protein B
MQRSSAVAGQFYPGRPEVLRQTVEDLLPPSPAPQPAIGVMVPHAGYVYSGAIAGETFARVRIPARVVIIGPNHRGVGHPAAVFPAGSWQTPLGAAAVDNELAQRLLAECPGLSADPAAHRFEHSLEVQVPFLQVLNPHAAIVPICLGHLLLEDLLAIGRALGAALARFGQEVLLVASTDMTHYESGEVARGKDRLALDRVLALDPEGLYRTVSEQRISMCGFIPTVMMLAATAELGATIASLVRYGNSGDVTGDQTQVVGYAGVVVS